MKQKLLLLLFFLGITTVSAQTVFTVGNVDYSTTSETTVTYLRLRIMTSIPYTIPSTVEFNSKTYTVTAIAANAFITNGKFETVTIPNTITLIKNGAFQGCNELASITIPNSVTSIEFDTFRNCTKLASVTIPNSITSIGHNSFNNCSSLTSFTIPTSVSSLGHLVFANCPSLAFSVTIPASITSMGDRIFENSTSLTSVICALATPPIINPDFFESIDLSKCTLEVPPSSVDAYKKSEVWKTFGTINGNTLGTDIFIAEKEALLYPNPFSNELFVALNNADNVQLKVSDINGKVLINKKVKTTSNKIDTSNLESGIYFVEVSYGNKASVKKLIKK